MGRTFRMKCGSISAILPAPCRLMDKRRQAPGQNPCDYDYDHQPLDFHARQCHYSPKGSIPVSKRLRREGKIHQECLESRLFAQRVEVVVAESVD